MDSMGDCSYPHLVETPTTAPDAVVGSQVYRWEVVLQEVIDDIDNGAIAGRHLVADLANGGVVIDYNPQLAPPDQVRQRLDELVAAIVDGSVDPGP